MTPTAAVDALLATAVDLGPPGPDDVFGAGRIDLEAAALRIASDADPTLPVATPLSTPAPDLAPTDAGAEGETGGVVSSPVEETSSPQPFVSDVEAVPPLATLVAVASILSVSAAALALRRRGLI